MGGAVPTIPPRKRRGISNRHWNPAFTKARNWKVLKVELPDYDWDRARARGDIPPEKIREKMKKNGLNPMANAAPPTYISSLESCLTNMCRLRVMVKLACSVRVALHRDWT